MRQSNRHSSWPRLLLWAHALGVFGFYLVAWLRTAASVKEWRLKEAPVGSGRASPPSKAIAVSILVPARDEERNIARCVTSLLEQDYGDEAGYEVIVIDDGSSDDTGRIVEEMARAHPHGARLRKVRVDALPPGWAGKPHAIHRGAEQARGAWLLLTDADTWHAPQALRTALHEASSERLDLLSLGSEQELSSFWERVLMPMAYLGISLQYPMKLVNDPNSSVAIANGQYLLIRRGVYDAVGGYARPGLRSTLVDDRDLARVVKQSGFRLRFLDGRGLVRVHMYHGFRETWRGWRKNVFLGSRGGLPYIMLQLLGLPQIAVVPFLLPLLLLLRAVRRWLRLSSGEVAAVSALELAPLLAYRFWEDRALAVPWYYAATHPLAGAVFEAILANSTWRVLTRRGVDWRGRSYYAGSQPEATAALAQLETSAATSQGAGTHASDSDADD
jgi:chlorobactene glucosyltransferase